MKQGEMKVRWVSSHGESAISLVIKNMEKSRRYNMENKVRIENIESEVEDGNLCKLSVWNFTFLNAVIC